MCHAAQGTGSKSGSWEGGFVEEVILMDPTNDHRDQESGMKDTKGGSRGILDAVGEQPARVSVGSSAQRNPAVLAQIQHEVSGLLQRVADTIATVDTLRTAQ
jgi:hypothetical protein